MQMTRSPVDELAVIRARITELRARETALELGMRQHMGSDRFPGFEFDAIVECETHEVFDIAKLPDAVLNNAAYYSKREVTTIRLEPRDESEAITRFTSLPRIENHAVREPA